MAGRGTLVLVVGASGAGKDSLLAGARQALGVASGFVFPRREVTRPAALAGEDHVAIDHATFAARDAAGAYALSWRAHGLGYGIPRGIESDLGHGRLVVVNVSRGVLDTARARYRPLAVINVEVPAAILAERLAWRGRETVEEIAGRLARAAAFTVEGSDVIGFRNDRPLPEATAAFVACLGQFPIKPNRPGSA